MKSEKKPEPPARHQKNAAAAIPLNPATASPAEPHPTDASPGFPIVGLGASAGGLAAFEAFFSGMPAATDPGMAFVLVQHLDPNHKSILTDLIRRYTRMPVSEVEDGMVVRANCVYIIPPGHDMALLNGALQLLEPAEPRGLRLPIDFFFRSLAQEQRERAIGIVLSGTGSDGTQGVRAIKGAGGILPELLEWLTPRRGIGKAPVFPTLQGKKSGGKFGLSLTFRDLMVRAEIKFADVAPKGSVKAFYDLGYHALRHSHITHAANAGVPEEVRREHVGHASDVHRGYTHRDTETTKTAFANMPRLINKRA